MQVERLNGLQHLRIPAGQTYKSPGKAYVEGDASSASYWLAGAGMLLRPPTRAGLLILVDLLSGSSVAIGVTDDPWVCLHLR